MKNTYWARFFKEANGRYFADVPDLPGCLTRGGSVEETYDLLIHQAIPLWLEDQAWPAARCADEIVDLPLYDGIPSTLLLVRVHTGEVSGHTVEVRPIWANQPKTIKRKYLAH